MYKRRSLLLLVCGRSVFLLPTNCLDGSHRLDKYEVQYWLENHGKYITLRQAQKIIEQMDFNADGYVEYSDFLATILGTWLGTTSKRGDTIGTAWTVNKICLYASIFLKIFIELLQVILSKF